MTLSGDENIPPQHLCLPTMDGEIICPDEPPLLELSVCTMDPRTGLQQPDTPFSPKSISLLDCEDSSGSVEVEITPDLAARFEDYDPGLDGPGKPSADFVAPRRRSITNTAAFPSHIPFPTLESPKKKRAAPTISPKGTTNTDRSQWIKESLEKMNINAEQRRTNSAACVGIESILSGMRQHRDNDRVQRYGCGALQKLACQGDTNRALIAEAGGVVDILTAMDRHLERASIQECACLALSSLSRARNGNSFIAEYNGIETILRAMRAHVAHEAVQKHGCLVLLNLACSNTNHNSAIAKLGGIEDIMAALSCHRGNAGITEYGSAALWSLAYMNTDNGDAIRKAGGLNAIFEVLSSTDKDKLQSISQEDQCMEVINKQRIIGEIESQDRSRRESQGVDAILSVFVRPLQQ